MDIVTKIPIIKNERKVAKIYPHCEYTLYFDGCSKGNPGPSGIGAVIYKEGQEIWCSSQYIGSNETNNRAEYSALIMGLEEAIKRGIDQISVYGDSQLAINQINGQYKVRNVLLMELYDKVIELKNKFKYIEFTHVYREDNVRADYLSNVAIKVCYSQEPVTIPKHNKSDFDNSFRLPNIFSKKSK
jgi:ribonuclease HI